MIKRFKYLLYAPFLLFLFFHYGSGQTTSDTMNKIVDCKYGPNIEILGNKDCTRMFCYVWNSKCDYERGKRETVTIICPASKPLEGGYTCPKAYDCAVSKTPEYDEAVKTVGSFIFSHKCDGAVSASFDETRLEPLQPLQSSPEDLPSNPVLNNPPPAN